ncbi:sensor domain-containing protein [Altericroceibacterium indicum]|nr:EAL domain-containing protein [Altericroceibacterium indicum]
MTSFLLGSRVDVSPRVAKSLTSGLFTSFAMFAGGVINSIALAIIAALRHPSALFLVWLLLECIIGLTRFMILIRGRRNIRQGMPVPLANAAFMACAWAASVGFGTAISLFSGDWLLATIVCFSAGAMISGICLRNFGTPRLAIVMMALVLMPSVIVSLFSPEPLLLVLLLQVPVFMFALSSCAFKLNKLFVSRITALHDLERSEKFNRAIFQSSPDIFLTLDEGYKVTFVNRGDDYGISIEDVIGKNWLSLLSDDDRVAGMELLKGIATGSSSDVFKFYNEASRSYRWYHIIATRISGDTNGILIAARDITEQKSSEDRALWAAHHDPLTGLPNRTVLQKSLDAIVNKPDVPSALLLLDVDNFKVVNDIFGHEAGDALLKFFGKCLQVAVQDKGLVSRIGGDEFAIVLSPASEADVMAYSKRIYSELRAAFMHDDKPLECNASIGVSLIPRDGAQRAEILKAADIALHSAKAEGRGKIKIYHPEMMRKFKAGQAMLTTARAALQNDTIVPFYQPKVALEGEKTTGFEALLRVVNTRGDVYGPAAIKAAFDDPMLAPLISDRMVDKVLADIQQWQQSGVSFGHVAINVSAADFRMRDFAEMIDSKLVAAGVAHHCIQVEVTETVFLGDGASYVEDALQRLRAMGVKVALDDFGTGYASLSHLVDYSVDALKIDRSFIQGIGKDDKADVIASMVVKLGISLGLEVVAEGIEQDAQAAALLDLGCATGQGFLYEQALPFAKVAQWISAREHCAI